MKTITWLGRQSVTHTIQVGCREVTVSNPVLHAKPAAAAGPMEGAAMPHQAAHPPTCPNSMTAISPSASRC